MAERFDPRSSVPFLRLLLMGPPKTVKTPLAIALARAMGIKAVYVAYDPGSEYLPSIPEPWMDDLYVIKPGPKPNEKYDVLLEAMNLADYPYKKDFPDAGLLIVDSASEMAEGMLQYVADQEFFSSSKTGDKHVTIGEGDRAMNLPVQGDYLAMKGNMERWIRLVFRQQMHLLVITHVDTDDKNKAGIISGPALVGKALIQDFPRHFQAVIRTQKRMESTAKGEVAPVLYVYTEGDAQWIGGVRHRPGETTARNPIPIVKVGEDLTAFWKLYLKEFMPILTRKES